MEYSKISTIELINFMSFKKAKVAFDETGIINIKGYNDSGKSAVLRGLVVCLMDMFKRNQAKFIRYGEEYFRVVVTFEDGVSILRDKYLNGQSLYEVYKDDECVFTTKQGNKLSKVDGVPQPIQDYLGLCVTDSVYLNYQSCIDKLPVVDTTGSENYQMFHEVLRMEEIYRASNMINTDKNELGGRIAEVEADIQRTEVLYEKCGDVTPEFIEVLRELEDEATETNNRKSQLDAMLDMSKRYESVKDIPEVKKVFCERYKSIKGIERTIVELEGIKNIPNIEQVSLEKLRNIRGIQETVEHIDSFISIPEVKKVDDTLIERGKSLGMIVSVFKKMSENIQNCTNIDTELQKVKKELEDLVSVAHKQGLYFTKCENCGSYTLVGGGHVHE